MRACTDQGEWALALALHLLGIVVDPAKIQHESGASGALGVDDLLRAVAQFPVKGSAVVSTIARLKKTPLPALAVMRSGGFAVIGKVTDEGVLLQGMDDPAPRLLSFAAFTDEWDG